MVLLCGVMLFVGLMVSAAVFVLCWVAKLCVSLCVCALHTTDHTVTLGIRFM